MVERLPDFAPALRRSCSYGFELGYVDLARRNCERAVRVAPNPSNKAALASILARRIAGRPMTVDDRNRAIGLAHELLVAQGPDRYFGLDAAAFVGEELGDRTLLHQAVGPLAKLGPHYPDVAYYVARDALNHGDVETAQRQLAFTGALGRRINHLLRQLIWHQESLPERALDLVGLADSVKPKTFFVELPIGLLLMFLGARRMRKHREARVAASAGSPPASSPPDP